MAIKAGWTDLGNGLVQNSKVYGGVVDVNNPIYTNAKEEQPIDNGPVATSTGTPPPITTQQQVGSTQATVGGQIQQGAPTTVAQSFQQALINRLNPSPISSASPEVAPAIQANQVSEQRSLEQNRAQAAERAASQGIDQNGFNSILNGLSQQSAERQGQFAGNAVMQANQEKGLNDRSALAMGAGLLGGNAGLSQQQALAELAAAVQREGIATQGSLGSQDIALRQRLGEGNLNLGLLTALLGNDQFGRSLSQQGAQFGAGLDQQGLLALLGGL